MKPTRKRAPLEPLHVNISGHNMLLAEPIRQYAESKVSRLSRYLDQLSRVDMVLSTEHTREASGRMVAEATAFVKGKTIRAEAADAEIHAAIDAVVDKLHLQLTRTKERGRDHKGRAAFDSDARVAEDEAGAPPSFDEDSGTVEDFDQRIVEVKQFSTKPMFPDEAVDALEELGRSFFVFLSAQTEQVNVVYRLRDGSYGLIEPAFE